MPLKIEIIPRFAEAAEADKLLYVPRHSGAVCHHTKVYHCHVEGNQEAFQTWIRRVILDETSQDMIVGPQAARPGAVVLEYGMKPGALDHEREMILDEYRCEGAADLGFSLNDLKVRTRLYFESAGGEAVDVSPFVRDLVNPAVHAHEVIEA